MKAPAMGNICGYTSAPTSRPPPDLASLLMEVQVPDDIEQSLWAKKFRGHLNSIGRSDLEAMLDFVIVCNVLNNKKSEAEQLRNVESQLTRINKERRELLRLIGDSFFSVNSEKPIPLSNKVLREELCSALLRIDEKSDDRAISQAFDLVWMARCDDKVWRRGLEQAYDNFISHNPTLSISAVLLSII